MEFPVCFQFGPVKALLSGDVLSLRHHMPPSFLPFGLSDPVFWSVDFSLSMTWMPVQHQQLGLWTLSPGLFGNAFNDQLLYDY